MLNEVSVFQGEIYKEPERCPGIFRLQTAVQKPLGALLEYPLYDVQDILEMIIEGLAGDAALLYQVFSGP